MTAIAVIFFMYNIEGKLDSVWPKLEIFTFDYLSDCVLYVPAGAKGVYASTEGWDNFSDIIELDSTGVSEIPFTGFEGLFDVYYDLQGRVVENPVKGVYILNGTKILVK